MTKPCPNCDQPLREGAKFCTSCGYHLEEARSNVPPPTAPPPGQKSPPSRPQKARRLKDPQAAVSTTDVTCPNCGKINRQGVKFCRFCGANLAGAPAVKQRSRARLVTAAFLVLVILMVCVSLVGISWGLGVDQWLFPTATPMPGGSLLPFLAT